MKRRLILLRTSLALTLISLVSGCVPTPSESYGSKPAAAPPATDSASARPSRGANY